ncbi:MAG: rhomboid family intramembrane serine protease [Desulfobulbaceae bacterium]
MQGDQPHGTGRASPRPLVVSGDRTHLDTCSLVLSAVAIPHVVDRRHGTLTVEADHADAARAQLEAYFRENEDWPVRPPPPLPMQGGSQPTLLLTGALAVFHVLTGPWQDHSKWFAAGAVDSRAILQAGEWWRLITALTLHADPVHLLGNCVIGGFLVHMLCRVLGPGLGWLLIIACGAAGNLCNILLREQAHLSVGFSTSVFAAIGIFTGLRMLPGSGARARELLFSFGAGGGLLAMLGTEGERTDLGAHFFGFACGLTTGIILIYFLRAGTVPATKSQFRLLLAAVTIVVIAWIFAMH